LLLLETPNKNLINLLVSAPVDLDFELVILKTGIDLVGNMLRTKFAT
jgi:hypothetical protein